MNTQSQIRIIGMGFIQAKPADQLKIGDILRWNFGYSSIVKSITPVTSKTLSIEHEDYKTKEIFTTRMRKTRLTAYEN